MGRLGLTHNDTHILLSYLLKHSSLTSRNTPHR
nr:MAG TPA: hypothetical protein [Caudoviricetes sp.]